MLPRAQLRCHFHMTRQPGAALRAARRAHTPGSRPAQTHEPRGSLCAWARCGRRGGGCRSCKAAPLTRQARLGSPPRAAAANRQTGRSSGHEDGAAGPGDPRRDIPAASPTPQASHRLAIPHICAGQDGAAAREQRAAGGGSAGGRVGASCAAAAVRGARGEATAQRRACGGETSLWRLLPASAAAAAGRGAGGAVHCCGSSSPQEQRVKPAQVDVI